MPFQKSYTPQSQQQQGQRPKRLGNKPNIYMLFEQANNVSNSTNVHQAIDTHGRCLGSNAKEARMTSKVSEKKVSEYIPLQAIQSTGVREYTTQSTGVRDYITSHSTDTSGSILPRASHSVPLSGHTRPPWFQLSQRADLRRQNQSVLTELESCNPGYMGNLDSGQ